MALRWYKGQNFAYTHENIGLFRFEKELSEYYGREANNHRITEDWHVLVNPQRYNGKNFRPDLVILKPNGVVVVDLKDYHVQNENQPALHVVADPDGEYHFADGENVIHQQGETELKQVSRYGRDLKSIIAGLWEIQGNGRFVVHGMLLFTAYDEYNLDAARNEVGAIKNNNGGRSSLSYVELCDFSNICEKIAAAAFNDPDRSLGPEQINRLLRNFGVTEYLVDAEQIWGHLVYYVDGIQNNAMPLRRDAILVGRGVDAFFQININRFSRRHFIITKRTHNNPGFRAMDINSRNGTFYGERGEERLPTNYMDFGFGEALIVRIGEIEHKFIVIAPNANPPEIETRE